MRHRKQLRVAVAASRLGAPAVEPVVSAAAGFAPSTLALAFATPHHHLAAAFRAAYEASIGHLLVGLRADVSFGDLAAPAFAVTEPGGVRPRDISTTVTFEDPTSLDATVKGTKSFVAQDAKSLIVVARVATDGVAVDALPPPRCIANPSAKYRLTLVHAKLDGHRFVAHDKPLPFVPELGPQGIAHLDGPAQGIRVAGSAALVDGTAALLGFRDIEDAHVAMAVAGHTRRVLHELQPADARSTLGDAYSAAIADIDGAAVDLASAVDDAACDAPGSEIAPANDALPPVLFSATARVQQYCALRRIRQAVDAAVELPGVSGDLRRDAKLLGVAQKVRDARWAKAMASLSSASA